MPCLTQQFGLKVIYISNVLHIIMELEYMLPLLSNVKGYYIFFKLQTYLRVGVAPPMIKTKLSENEFFAMWDLEFKECLFYSSIYGYFVYNEWPKEYGRLECETWCPKYMF